MKEITINGTVRKETGKKATRAARKEGLVPCVLYGEEKDANGKPIAEAFTAPYEELRKLLFTPDIFLVNIMLDGKKRTAIVQDSQFHPVKDTILHVDFFEVHAEKPIVMAVPIRTEGLAPGVQAGGRLNVPVRTLKVRATYQQIPEMLVVDISKLRLGKSIKVGQLSYDGLELVTPKDVVVCTGKMTRTAQTSAATEEEAPEEAAAAAPAEGEAAEKKD